MAITFVKVKVANMANPRRSRRYEFLVDSGAVYIVLPESELKKLGVKPTSEEEFTFSKTDGMIRTFTGVVTPPPGKPNR